jgi:ABC-2 type transport system ATP-binding protein
MIRVDDLQKNFGDVEALTGVSFSVEEREIVGFLGPNAAGKTTTMRIITGYLPPDAGSVTVAGYTIPGQSLSARRHIGYLPENVSLYRELTTRGFLEYMGILREVPRLRRGAAVDAAIERCGLESVQNRIIGGLSKGFKQRVGLAQALVHDPKVMIFDEPTVGLDPKQIHEVRALIKELGRDHTIILSSHILSEVSATCDRVVIINKGRVIAEDTTQGLAARLHGALPVRIEIRGPESDVQTFLESLAEVDVVDTRVSSNQTIIADLRMPGDVSIREQLAKTVVLKGWGLLELSPGGTSLEEVFLQLTQEEES